MRRAILEYLSLVALGCLPVYTYPVNTSVSIGGLWFLYAPFFSIGVVGVIRTADPVIPVWTVDVHYLACR